MTTSDHLYELTARARARVAAAARDGEVHPLQPSWYSLSRLLYYAPRDQAVYRETAADNSSWRPSLIISLDSKPGGSLTLRWRSPSDSSFGALTLLRPPAESVFDLALSAVAMHVSYDDHALFARLTAAVYRSLVARFEEWFAVEHENWLVLHRSPLEHLEVVGTEDFATESAGSDARAALEAYTSMRLSYLRDAFKRAFCLFPVLRAHLQIVSERELDGARLRALCNAYDAEQSLADERIMSPNNAAYLAVTLGRLRQLKAGREASPERMASVLGCPPDLVPQFLAELKQ